MRIGIGYDIHRLVEGRDLVLGGVRIPFKKGLLGHSDADVLYHALCDALLGAAGQGDIGQHFPDTDPQFKGVSSKTLLERSLRLLEKKGYAVNNVDAIIMAEAPNLSPFKKTMESNISSILGIDAGDVNVKAKTSEGMGPIGEGKAMAATCVASVISKPCRHKEREA
jgi:2-C-methyl-D-erythritol 2,4-cyclodiphosphate synthase